MSRIVLATFVLSLLWYGQAAACSCAGTFEQIFRGAPLVFDGVARSIQSMPDPEGGQSDLRLVTTFEVTRAIKGAKRTTVEVSHWPDLGGNCGIEFGIGERVRVIAFGSAGHYGTSLCEMRYVTLWDEKNQPQLNTYFRELLAKVRSKDASEDDVDLAAWMFLSRQSRQANAGFIDDYASKVEQLEKLRETSGNEALARVQVIADLFEYWQDFEHMDLAYAAASRIAPLDPLGAAGRGRALYMLARYAKARPFLEAALKLNPKHPSALGLLARTRLILEGHSTRGNTDYSRLGAAGLIPESEFGQEPPFVSVTLSKASGFTFFESKIEKLSANRAILTRTDFSGVEIKEGSFQGAELSNANFTSAKVKANFDGARLRHIRAPYGDFSGSSFLRADLSNANAPQSTWSGADLRNIRLIGANLEGAGLSEAKLQGTDFRRARTAGIKLRGARADCATRLPAGTDVRKAQIIPVEPVCGRVRQNRDFSGQDWSSIDFSGLDLSGADFSGGDFGGTDFSGGNFARADFSRSDLENAKFLGANFQQADFSNTSDNPWTVNTGGDGYAGADLSAATFSNAKGVGRFNGRDLREYGKKIYPPAKLDRTDFSGAEIDMISFLGFSDDENEPADISTAIFDGSKISCAEGDSDVAKSILKGESTEGSVTYHYPPELVAKLPTRRREEFEKRNEIQRRAAERSLARFEKYVHRQRDMVRHIAKAWPTATFESCEIYLADPPDTAN